MDENGNTKLSNAKKAAKSLVNKVMEITGATVKVGVVTFNQSYKNEIGLTGKAYKSQINDAINNIRTGAWTNIQAGIKAGRDMLATGSAQNKIMIVLSDGEPNNRFKFNKVERKRNEESHYIDGASNDGWYKCNTDNYDEETSGWFNKKYYAKDLSTETISDTESYLGSFKAYNSFDYSGVANPYVNYKYGDIYVKDATISEAFLARKQFASSNFNIYSVGYDVNDSSEAKDILQKIADKEKYSLASVDKDLVADDLSSVIDSITDEVKKTIYGVNLFDNVPGPEQIKAGEDSAIVNNSEDINAKIEGTSSAKFTWNKPLEKNTYTMSFIETLYLDELNPEDFHSKKYFNTNGEKVEAGGKGVDSSVLSYGAGSISLDSPQLPLESYKYEVHYFYDENDDGTYSSYEENTSSDYLVGPKYVFKAFDDKVPTYELEDKSIDGYELDYVTINGNKGSLETLVINEDKAVNVYYKKQHKRNIIIEKKWEDGENQDGKRADSVTVYVKEDGKDFKTVTLSAETEWKAEIKDVKSSAKYSVLEEAVQGYENVKIADKTEIVDGVQTTTFTITNTHTPETRTLSVNKNWLDKNNQDGKRPPQITVSLKAGNDVVETATITAPETTTDTDNKNVWSYTFEKLPMYDAEGNEIKYTVDENTVDGYSKEIKQDNSGTISTITNTHEDEKTSLKVEKEWNDDSNRDKVRPASIRVELLCNDKSTGKYVELSDNKLVDTFDNLDVYSPSAEGGAIKNVYTVKESMPKKEDEDNYKSSIVYNSNHTEATITNTHVTEKVELSVTKRWDDHNNQDGVRPTSVQVQLLANDKDVVDTITLGFNEEDKTTNWSHTWTVNKNEAGIPINYSVREVEVSNYTSEAYNGLDFETSDSITIVNTHTPATTSVNVKKIWDDSNDNDGIRPDSITVNLLADGKNIDSKVIKPDENKDWKTVFDNLPKYSEGKEIKYTVTENSVEGYTAVVKKISNNNYEITNTHNVTKTSRTVTKVWNDNNNQDGIRPESVTVQLLGNGVLVENGEVTLNNENKWTYTWNDLDVNKEGTAIVYTVVEVSETDGYKSNVTTGQNDTDVIVTNTHEIEKVNLSAKKQWNDNGNQDGIRPSLVTVRLFKNDEEIRVATLSNDNSWQADFGEYDKYENGQLIEYTVKEDSVSGYTTSVGNNGGEFVVTNSHNAASRNLTVLFNWDDLNDIDGERPETMQVQLFANGYPIGGEKTVKATDNWKYTWYGLSVYSAGSDIKYTVAQVVALDKYEYIGTTEGTLGVDYIITNKYVPTVDKTITIIWDDEDDKSDIRPDEVTIQPTVDGEEVGEPIKITVDDKDETDDNKWQETVTLPKYDEDGNEIEYKVVQDKVDKYDTTYSDDTLTITNKYREPVIIVPPFNPPLVPVDPDEPTDEPTVKPSEEPEVTVEPSKDTNLDNEDNQDEIVDKDDDKFNEAPATSQAPEKVVKADKANNNLSATTDDATPKTGDYNNTAQYIALLLISALGIVMVYSNKRKFNKEK